MSTTREGNQKKKGTAEAKAVSWQEKKSLADKEEEVLKKEIEDLVIWAETMDSMNDEQKKEYLYNRPHKLKTVKIQKGKPRQRVRYKVNSRLEFPLFFMVLTMFMFLVQVQRVEKSKPSTSNGILASVWKFHKEDDDEFKSGSNV